MNGPQAALLADGRRLHLNHGPIDLVLEAFGAPAEIEAAYAQACGRFDTILTELVEELPALRQPSTEAPRAFAHMTARRMEGATGPLPTNSSSLRWPPWPARSPMKPSLR